MASIIQLKTGTGSAAPTSLAQGEAAINIDNGQRTPSPFPAHASLLQLPHDIRWQFGTARTAEAPAWSVGVMGQFYQTHDFSV